MTTLQEFQDDLYKSGIVPTKIFRDYENNGGEVIRVEVTYANGSVAGLEYVNGKPYQAYTIDDKGKRQVVPCTDSPENQNDTARQSEAEKKVDAMIRSHQSAKTISKKTPVKVQRPTAPRTVKKTTLPKTVINNQDRVSAK